MGKTGALILAAGRGTRMGTEVPKQFLKIGGKTLFLYSVEAFLPFADRVILVTGDGDRALAEAVLSEAGLREKVGVTAGGATRAESSCRGLSALLGEGNYEYVMIHDAARANVTEDVIRRCIETLRVHGTAVAAVPATDTMKIAGPDGIVSSTPDRSTLYSVQTPQAFRTELLAEGFRRLFKEAERKPELLSSITDDSAVVERFTDHPVKLFPGAYENRKITVPSDLSLFGERLGK